MATNGYTDAAAPALQRRLVPIGSYIIATEPLDERAAARAVAAPARWRSTRNTSCTTSASRRIGVCCSEDARSSGGPTPDTTRRAAAILHRGMTTIFPELAGRADRLRLGRQRGVHARPDAARRRARRRCTTPAATAATASRWQPISASRSRGGSPASRSSIRCSTIAFRRSRLYSGNPWFLPLVGAYYQVMDWLQ